MGATLAPRPCGSCPYRRDVPAGIWESSEYAKLPPYDNETALQPLGAFFCHQQDGRLCAGWVGCHGADGPRGLLALRMMLYALSRDEVEQIAGYETDVPLFASGAEAAAHGLSGVDYPDEDAYRMIDKLERKRAAHRESTASRERAGVSESTERSERAKCLESPEGSERAVAGESTVSAERAEPPKSAGDRERAVPSERTEAEERAVSAESTEQPERDPFVIRIVGGVEGMTPEKHPELVEHFGRYVTRYQPENARLGEQWLWTSIDIREALGFDDIKDLHSVYAHPVGVRADGRPDRPITAFHIQVARRSQFLKEQS